MFEEILVWISSEAVLGTLFDGALGAAIGAGVAVVVLKKTLNEQRVGLSKQLDKQDKHHQEQLRIQREENSRTRLHDVIAEILGDLTRFTLAVQTQSPDFQDDLISTRLKLAVNLERFNLDVPASELRMYGVLSGLTTQAMTAAMEHESGRMPAQLVLTLSRLSGAIGAYLVEWARSEGEERAEITALGHSLLLHLLNSPPSDWPSGLPDEISRAGMKKV
ncbi:hypothetical protein FQ154_09760 [Paeniglutamicibacter gangotriensis]|uniref:Uncharacterized protein n=1 Tax=Paeniglutamicibacter gangotriensis TaxID=254787 RepID=A0A5B0EFL9_9MICC|nr:hypothetical protein [Paeniglutamicibacter gangotriensis]KAA0977172.1 hypothetical protein FQ154_09760 [Paeniglutamicibacter gangotriensis]